MDADRVDVYSIRLRQLRELVKPISSFTRPSTFGEATMRIKHNLSHFRSTYVMFVLSIIYLSFFLDPLVIFFALVYSLCLVLYFCYDGPFVLFNGSVNDRIVLGVLGVLTSLYFFPSGVWLNVLVWILIGFAAVVIHAAFRGTEDLCLDWQEVDGNEDLPRDLQVVDGNEDLLWDLVDGGVPIWFYS